MRSNLRTTPRQLTRRDFAFGTLGGAAAAFLSACGDDGSGVTDDGTTTGTTTDPTTGGSGDASSATTGTTDPTTGDTMGAACGEADAWATGGTAAMTRKNCYPDPFAGGVAGCMLMCETTAGPCTADTMERQDISEGWAGLPVRLALLVVAADTCEPIADAKVEIWHTQRTGVYSGQTPNDGMCHGGDDDAGDHLYFRGTQTTDAAGRVDFDTCFPGWYMGRAVHIHFRVYRGDNLHITSQLFFADTLNSEIFADHPDYSEFGQPDTTNTDDNIIGGEDDLGNYLLTTARLPDGAMLASKVIAIRGSLDQATCQLGGGMGMP